MQFKTFFALASLVAAAAAIPNEKRQDDAASASVDAATVSVTSFFTTQTFTASMVLQSFIEQEPWVTTISTSTVWTAARTVTLAAPTDTASA